MSNLMAYLNGMEGVGWSAWLGRRWIIKKFLAFLRNLIAVALDPDKLEVNKSPKLIDESRAWQRDYPIHVLLRCAIDVRIYRSKYLFIHWIERLKRRGRIIRCRILICLGEFALSCYEIRDFLVGLLITKLFFNEFEDRGGFHKNVARRPNI